VPSDLLRTVEALAGAVLVAAVLSDVFRSVVLPRASGRTLRLGPMVARGLLRLILRTSRRDPRLLHARMGMLGPLLIVLELVLWISLMIAGYTLMLHASQGLRPTTSFGDSLHAISSGCATTGLSGQAAASDGARLVVSLAGLSGLTTVTLVISFLLSVQSGLVRREALVIRLRSRIGGHPSGPLLLETLSRLGRGRDAVLPVFFQDWESWCAEVLLTHRAYPILVYFRSTDRKCGWLAALGSVLDAASLVITMRHEDGGEHARVCHRLGVRLAHDLARQLSLPLPPHRPVESPAFARAAARLSAAGYVALPPDAATRFNGLHARYAPAIEALARYLGEQRQTW
jgi:hypothetical protein